MHLLDLLKAYAKAVAGVVTPGAGLMIAAIQAKSPGGDSITQGEWIGIVVAIVVGGGVVALAPANVAPVDDSDLDDEPAGQADEDLDDDVAGDELER